MRYILVKYEPKYLPDHSYWVVCKSVGGGCGTSGKPVSQRYLDLVVLAWLPELEVAVPPFWPNCGDPVLSFITHFKNLLWQWKGTTFLNWAEPVKGGEVLIF